MAKKKSTANSSVYFNKGQTIQFYPDFVAPRTFFFESLRSNANPQAQRILKIGENMININQLDNSLDEEMFLKTTLDAIEFLKRAAQETLKNERRIFEEQIVPLCRGTEFEIQCNECFSGDTVDYINFLALINKLALETDEALVLLNDLYDSMKNYNDLSKEIIETNDYTAITTHYTDFSTQIQNQAAIKKKKIVSDRAKIFANQLEIYRNQIEKDNSDINILKDFLHTHLSDVFSGKKKKYNQHNVNAYMTNLISAAEEFILAYQDLSSKDNNYKIDQLIQPFIDLLEEDQELKEKFLTQMKKKTQQLDKQGELLQQKQLQLQQIIDKLLSDTIKANSVDKYISGLTLNIRQYLAKLYPELAGEDNEFITGYVYAKNDKGELTGKKELRFNMNKKEHREKYFNALKTVILGNEKVKDIEIIKKINNLIKQKEKKKETITIASEFDSTRLRQVVEAICTLTGKENLKNDLTGFTIATISLEKDGYSKKDIQALKETLQNSINQIDSQYGQQYTLEIKRESRIKDSSGAIIKEGKKSKNYHLSASLKTQQATEDRFIKQIQRELKDKRNLAIKAKDIFQIDNSVKFHETYIDKTGFTGGSLGADIETQIKNINNMLELGGITPINAEFLINAVLNAGPALIGAHQRSALENYFSTVASMLMFRSGGQALQNFSSQGLNYINNDTTKIHIYTFNTVFFPESYILQKTYEGLAQCINLLTTNASNYGSRASIYNPISDKDIVYDFEGEGGKNSDNHKMSPIKIPNWEMTAAKNYKKVSIDMVLMGGFLDVMEKMLTVMNNIFK